jgi:hypothetical protein
VQTTADLPGFVRPETVADSKAQLHEALGNVRYVEGVRLITTSRGWKAPPKKPPSPNVIITRLGRIWHTPAEFGRRIEALGLKREVMHFFDDMKLIEGKTEVPDDKLLEYLKVVEELPEHIFRAYRPNRDWRADGRPFQTAESNWERWGEAWSETLRDTG